MTTLVVTHNAGFFSCCERRLVGIIAYFNHHAALPDIVDSSQQLSWYKSDPTKDITFEYFENYNSYPTIQYTSSIFIDYEPELQFADYSIIQYSKYNPFIQKYFSPSSEIVNLVRNLETKYNINYDNICVLFYRGNDKNRETHICGYDEYITYANKLLEEHPTIQFLIQSDETGFIEKMLSVFPNSIYFKDEIRHIPKQNNTVDLLMRENIEFFSKNYLAITILMAKCKYIVCGSGNCSLWIMFYRGNTTGVYQNRNNQWLHNGMQAC